MPKLVSLRQVAVRSLVFVATLLLSIGVAHGASPTGPIISQLYGAGGNSGASLNADYVELFNPTGSPISLAGYSIQYASAAGTSISANIAITGSPTLHLVSSISSPPHRAEQGPPSPPTRTPAASPLERLRAKSTSSTPRRSFRPAARHALPSPTRPS